MTTTQIIQMLSLIALLLGSAFFSGSETALMSLSRIRVRNMVDKGVPKASIVHRLLSEPGRLLSALLIGNNIVNIVSSSIATVFFISLFGPKYGVPSAVVAMTLLVLIFGEILPKTVANHAAERWALKVSSLIVGLMSLLSPLISIFTWLTNRFMRVLGYTHKGNSLVTEDEIRTVINLGQKEGVLEADERNMLTSVLEFNDTVAREVMIPRVDMFALDVNQSVEAAAKIAVQQQYSRIPIYRTSVDYIIGLVHVKDLLVGLLKSPQTALKELMRPVLLIPEAMPVGRLLEMMQRQKASMAIVLDEYGATSGIVTIEDIVEEIVGEIHDEYDEADSLIEALDERITLMDGSLSLAEVNDQLGINLPEDEADTIGGFIFFQVGRIPRVGDVVEYHGWDLTVEEMEGRRVAKVKVGKEG